MGRWRPPRIKGSPYITSEGAQKMQDELRQLWKVERPKITDIVHEAAKNGDRSENGDYIYGKKRLREIDGRVRFLSKRLDELNVVDRIPDDKEKVFFGAWVTLEDDNGNEKHYRIVGPDEFNLRENKLSMDSPLAKCILGKRLGDEICFHSPEGDKNYIIACIRYEKPNTQG